MTAESTRVADDGLWVSGACTDVVDVLFDDRRVFTASAERYRVDETTGLRRVPWPGVLRPYLTGSSRVVVRTHTTGEVWIDEEHAFDDAHGRTSVTDEQGYPLALDKWWFLVRTFDASDPTMATNLLGDLTRLLGVLNDDLGVPAFLAYGTLLGAVREGAFIGHDNDADIAYVSHFEHPADIARESFRLERGLRAAGWRVERSTGAFVRVWADDSGDSQRKIDVFTGYFRDGGFTIERWVHSALQRESILPLATAELEGVTYPVPARPEDLLAATYGEGWRVPDPAFSFRTPPALMRRSDGWFGEFWLDQWTWSIRAREQEGEAEPSAFARWVEPQLADAGVTDLGCGTGADATWLGRAGRQVVGLDYAEDAVARATALAAATGSSARFEQLTFLDLRATLTTAARLAAPDRAAGAAISRGLLEVLPAEGRRHLWLCCRVLLGGGGRLYLEVPDPTGIEDEVAPHGHVVSQEWVGDGPADDGARRCRLVLTWGLAHTPPEPG